MQWFFISLVMVNTNKAIDLYRMNSWKLSFTN